MTFSLVARLDDAVGVAVASKFLAVGSAVPAVEAGVGAIATQSYANLAYKAAGLALLRSGTDAQSTLDVLLAGDPDREQRQVGVVDAAGRAVTFTGDRCHGWAGGSTGDGYAAQGNILAGPEVVEAIERTWLSTSGPLAERLLAALAAGDEAGGDKRGRQGAALIVAQAGAGYGGLSDIEVDLRVDDHPAPVGELRRLLGLHRLYFGKPDPATLLPLEGPIADEVAQRLQRLGHATLEDWAGVENYEERMVPGQIDPLVLEKLREATG